MPWGSSSIPPIGCTASSLTVARRRTVSNLPHEWSYLRDMCPVIPKFTSMKYFLRATTAEGMERVKEKVMPCFEWVWVSSRTEISEQGIKGKWNELYNSPVSRAAALATGCTHSVKFNDLLTDIRNCKPIGVSHSPSKACNPLRYSKH